VSYFTTSLSHDEMLVEVVVPGRRPGEGWAFREFAPRHGDFALVGVAARLIRAEDGKCTAVRLVGCGLSAMPVDLSAGAESLLGASELSGALLRDVVDEVGRAVEPVDDIHASPTFRRELAQLLTVDALRAAWARCGTEGRAA
jgi:carbon-monoxide dehydrogenase medium subunit